VTDRVSRESVQFAWVSRCLELENKMLPRREHESIGRSNLLPPVLILELSEVLAAQSRGSLDDPAAVLLEYVPEGLGSVVEPVLPVRLDALPK